MNKDNFAAVVTAMIGLSESFKKAGATADKAAVATKEYSQRSQEKKLGRQIYRGPTISKKVGKQLHNEKMTNNDRVALMRAGRMGLTLAEYRMVFPKGGHKA